MMSDQYSPNYRPELIGQTYCLSQEADAKDLADNRIMHHSDFFFRVSL